MYFANNKFRIGSMFGVLFGCAGAASAGVTSAIPTSANVAGAGSVQIGSTTVDPGQDVGEDSFLDAVFVLGHGFAFLDEWYNFRWINVLTGYKLPDGSVRDSDGDGNPDAPDIGELPAMDPQPDSPGEDDEPYYYNDGESAIEFPGGGVTSQFRDSKNLHPAGTVLTFRSYLVLQSETDITIDGMSLCILMGFEWTSTFPIGGGGSVEAQTLSITNPGQADVDLIDKAIDNADDEGDAFGAGWAATTECILSACEEQGACCMSSQDCEILSPTTCASSGGIYHGDGEACKKTTCLSGSAVPTVSEWAAMGMTLLLLTAATIVFCRRQVTGARAA